MSETTTEPETEPRFITLRKGQTIIVNGVPRKVVGIGRDRVRLVRVDESRK